LDDITQLKHGDSRAREVARSANNCSLGKIHQQIFYKRERPPLGQGNLSLRACEQGAAVRYLDADETISNESIVFGCEGLRAGAARGPGLEGVKRDLRV
jgi:hypothetical protein